MARRQREPGPAVTPQGLYAALHAHYGDLEWWPAEGPFEVMVGAVLTQRTAWRNVERALANLRDAGVTDMATLLAIPLDRLEALIRSSGTYRQKATRLRDLFTMVHQRGGGSLEAFLDLPRETLRQELLGVRGIGAETADSIVLYAADMPVFVVDAYTRRVLERLGVEPGRSYDRVASWFTDGIPRDAGLYNNYHAVIVELAKDHCRTRPVCEGCPISHLCPVGIDSESP